MLHAMSTYVYVKQRLHPGLLDGLARSGAQAIEIFAARGHFDYTRRDHLREIAAWFRDGTVPLNSVHAPMFSDYEFGRSGAPALNVAATERRQCIEAMDEIKRAIAVAEYVPFRFLVQHVGSGGDTFEPRKQEAAITSIEHLRAFAKPLGVTLLVENIPNELSTPEKLLELIKEGRFDDVGVCFDLGHAHIVSSVREAFATLKAHIRSTHVHDNARDRDAHLWPGDGSIDWAEAMTLLRSAVHVPPLLMEIDGDGGGNVTQHMAEAFSRLESAAVAGHPEP